MRPNHLVLDNYLEGSFLGRNNFPSLSIPLTSKHLYWQCPCSGLFKQPCCWHTMAETVLPFTGDPVSQQIFLSSSPCSPSVSPWQCSLSLGCRSCFVDIVIKTGLHNSTLWLVGVFFSGLCLLQREVFLMRGEDYFIFGHKDKCLDCC